MNYLPVSDSAARQIVDSVSIFSEWRRAALAARSYAGGMYFKKEGDYEYLVKTFPNNKQQRHGRRSPETEKIFNSFIGLKAKTEDRVRSLSGALAEAERMNKALKVGRAPNKVVTLLNTLDDAGLGEHFTVVGTNALYAFEAAASVHIESGAMATLDVDLLWDARRKVQFVNTMKQLDQSMLQVLRRVSPTFERKEDQRESVVDDTGFEVEFLRRETIEGDEHPFKFTDDDDDVFAVPAPRAAVLTSAPRFEHVVISSTGRMALMRTIAPAIFVEFKRWMAELPNREAGKRRRDARQADIVSLMLTEGLLLA